MIRKIQKKLTKQDEFSDIDPDIIFMDSTNLPDFDTNQFEGRIVRPIARRSLLILGLFFLFILGSFLTKLWFLEVRDGSIYAEASENNRLKRTVIFADRGIIYDRNRVPIAWNDIRDGFDFSIRTHASSSPGFAHLLGTVDYPKKDKYGFYWEENYKGTSGVEASYNPYLTGHNGLQVVETDALGHIKSQSVIDPPKQGGDLVLSIDAELQQKIYETMQKSATDYGFKSGATVIMDIYSGEILAMVSFPEYNLDVMTNGASVDKTIELNRADNPFLNRVTSGLYTPGSIVKPFMAVAALTEGIISPEKQILSTGALKIPNPYVPGEFTIFRDWKAHGLVDMRHALAVSSDVYFYEIGGGFEDQPGLGIERIKKYFNMFGLGEKTGINLAGEKEGTIPSPEWKKKVFDGENWLLGNTYHTAIGQYGVQITPLQAVRAAAALANHNTLVTPTLLLNDTSNDGKDEILSLDEKNIDVAREGMRLSVTEGIAQNVHVPYVTVAAKTGTAEVGISKSLVNSWIIGFFPYEKPKYAFAVVMERGPRANLVGSPYVLRQVFDWMNVNTPEYFKN